jgi:hypothetical protein
MTRVFVSLSTALLLALAGATIGSRAQAAAIAPAGLRPAADQVANIDKVQFVYRGRRFCWYPTGWRGPGWYRCGFRWRRGLGWGGPVGWRGWRAPGRPGVRPPHRPGIRPPIGHVPRGRPGHRPGRHNAGTNRLGGGSAAANRPGGGGPGGSGRGGRGSRGNRGGGNG